MHAETLISDLMDYSSLGEVDNQYRLDIISFMQKFPDSWWQRSTPEGHVTASAWILNREKTHVLFLHHRKLNKWLQPGGHLDETDFSPANGALREAIEETGINKLTLTNPQKPALFDVDIHRIPARGAEPAHFHYDVRYLLNLPDESGESGETDEKMCARIAISNESLGFRWFSIAEVVREHEPSLARMAKKTLLSLNMHEPKI